jgi:predicted nucleic acid-binding protein
VEIAAVLGRGPVAIDTAIFLYFIEEHPAYLPLVEPVFEAIGMGKLSATASSLTILETLVVPLRSGDSTLAHQYEDILAGSRGLRLVPLDTAVLRGAAMLRARLRLKTPDAIHLASALSAKASAFLTHDRSLPEVPGIRTVLLSELST